MTSGSRWKHVPVVAFDTETTGLQPFNGDRIIEVAAVVFHLQVSDVASSVVIDRIEEHSWLVNPGMPIPRAATEVSGIRNEDVASAPPFEEIAEPLWHLFANAVTVAHNYPFDLAFLTQEFLRVQKAWPEPLAEVDTVDLSIRTFAGVKSHKLADVAVRCGVVLDGAHRARNDAEACGRSFLEMARKNGTKDDLQAMLDWAGAIGRPPEDGPFVMNDQGRLSFREGAHAGYPIADHPVHLAWMEKAKQRVASGWDFRFSESTRRWVRRWLEVRGAGRARSSAKDYAPEEWVLDPSWLRASPG